MSKKHQLKQLELTLFFEPHARDADRFALGVLQRWFQRSQSLSEGETEFDFGKIRLHKDIYLSGLFLCLLSPKLCKTLANNLGPDQVNLDMLRFAFESNDLPLVEERLEGAGGELDYRSLASHLSNHLGNQSGATIEPEQIAKLVLERLQPTMAQALQAAEANAGAGNQGGATLEPSLIAKLVLEQLQPTMAQALQAVEANLGNTNDNRDSGGNGGEIALMQTQMNAMAQQIQEQTRLLREQSRLLNRLASRGFSAAASSGNESGEESFDSAPIIEDLSLQAANARKVRAKGIF